MQRYQEFMEYVDMDIINGWSIREDAPQWAKDDFYEYLKAKQEAQENQRDI